MEKQCKVVMLPTNEKAIVPNRLCLHNGLSSIGKESLIISKDTTKQLNKRLNEEAVAKGWYKPQHLYILSDEEIKEGDWCIKEMQHHGKHIMQAKGISDIKSTTAIWKKIIASNDKSLTEKIEALGTGSTYVFNLLQIHQSFIEHFVAEYNKGNVITDVMVEYEVHPNSFVPLWIPKVNPDNTININSYTVKQDIFTDEFLTDIGFTLIERYKSNYKPYPIYGKAKDKTGMTIIEWCDEGHSCTYFGEKLEPNTSVAILKDGGTRTVFNGYVYTQNDFRKVLSLTW